jgi:hypothetical protein
MIVGSFYEKAELEQFIKSEINVNDYSDLLEGIWTDLVEKELSFVVKNEDDNVIAVAINFDVRDEPQFEIDNALAKIFQFLEYVEASVRYV